MEFRIDERAHTPLPLYADMYPIRNGGHYNLSAIREGVETMPVRLARLGYRVLAGKWHINPSERGFLLERVPIRGQLPDERPFAR